MVMCVTCAAVFAACAVLASLRKGRSAMVIVEPRRHPMLRRVLENFHATMPQRYDLYVFHGTANGKFARRAARAVAGRRVFFVSLGVDNLDVDAYNALLKSREFYESIDAENILVFQTDAFLCSDSPFRIEDFERYSYIGCPYDDQIGKGVHWGSKNSFYGVGGLSFRHRSVCLKCIEHLPKSDVPEDVFFSNCVEDTGTKPENARVLQMFCSQNRAYDGSWGAHQVTSMGSDDKNRFVRSCPESVPFFLGHVKE